MAGLWSSSMRYSNAEAGASFAPGWLANRLVPGAIAVCCCSMKSDVASMLSNVHKDAKSRCAVGHLVPGVSCSCRYPMKVPTKYVQFQWFSL